MSVLSEYTRILLQRTRDSILYSTNLAQPVNDDDDDDDDEDNDPASMFFSVPGVSVHRVQESIPLTDSLALRDGGIRHGGGGALQDVNEADYDEYVDEDGQRNVNGYSVGNIGYSDYSYSSRVSEMPSDMEELPLLALNYIELMSPYFLRAYARRRRPSIWTSRHLSLPPTQINTHFPNLFCRLPQHWTPCPCLNYPYGNPSRCFSNHPPCFSVQIPSGITTVRPKRKFRDPIFALLYALTMVTFLITGIVLLCITTVSISTFVQFAWRAARLSTSLETASRKTVFDTIRNSAEPL
ncbi:hypothetical protein BC936DRAFT_142118 [Jimgerdemannia flammicorona]|uniref:Uncharacterized protein n=1 Tax=Jimgerdemannia flammicorona TaxID=994334 RepID=A0A433A0Z2_9FUNG|nr:hypothetical protein BC936DRAFT_142118 [Jimgerdemannia flammicorona]